MFHFPESVFHFPESMFHFRRNRRSTSAGFRVPLPPEYARYGEVMDRPTGAAPRLEPAWVRLFFVEGFFAYS